MFGYPIFRPTQVFLQYCKNASAGAGAKVQNRKVQLKFKCRRNKGRSPVTSCSSFLIRIQLERCRHISLLPLQAPLHSTTPLRATGTMSIFRMCLGVFAGRCGDKSCPVAWQRNCWGQDHCHPTRAHGDWWLARAAWATIAGAPEPVFRSIPWSHGCCFSLLESYPAHPSSFGWGEAKIFHLSTGMAWNILEPWSHQGLVVIERTSLLHVTLPVVCKAGSIHRMLVGLVLAFP